MPYVDTLAPRPPRGGRVSVRGVAGLFFLQFQRAPPPPLPPPCACSLCVQTHRTTEDCNGEECHRGKKCRCGKEWTGPRCRAAVAGDDGEVNDDDILIRPAVLTGRMKSTRGRPTCRLLHRGTLHYDVPLTSSIRIVAPPSSERKGWP